jgi:hypothetical protein
MAADNSSGALKRALSGAPLWSSKNPIQIVTDESNLEGIARLARHFDCDIRTKKIVRTTLSSSPLRKRNLNGRRRNSRLKFNPSIPDRKIARLHMTEEITLAEQVQNAKFQLSLIRLTKSAAADGVDRQVIMRCLVEDAFDILNRARRASPAFKRKNAEAVLQETLRLHRQYAVSQKIRPR